jgi:hypothetical protein
MFEIGGSSSMPSYTEAPSESEEEEEYVPDGEEEEGEEEEAEEGEEEEAVEGGGGEVDPELWGDLSPGAPKGWLRGTAGVPTPPSIEAHKWLIEPAGQSKCLSIIFSTHYNIFLLYTWQSFDSFAGTRSFTERAVN